MQRSFTLEELPLVAEAFWQQMADKKAFAFHGNLGAGKTTFIHALAQAKGVTDAVSSPTFSIIQQYAIPDGFIYHMDLYRLKDEEEAIGAGVEDALYSGSICMVEWPERAEGLFPEDTVHVYLQVIDSLTREIKVKR